MGVQSPFWCRGGGEEQHLTTTPPPSPNTQHSFPQAQSVRKALQKHLEHDRVSTSTEMMKSILKHRTELGGMDDYFGIENSLLSMLAGRESEKRVQELVRNCFPRAGALCSVEDTEKKLLALRANDGYRFLPSHVQACIAFGIKLISAIASQTTSQLKMNSVSPFWKGIWLLCGNYVSTTGILKEGDSIAEHLGEAAVAVMINRWKRKIDDAEQAQFKADLLVLDKLSWVVPVSLRAALGKLKEKEGAPAASAAPKGKAKAVPKKSANQKEQEQAEKEAMAIFNE